MTLTNEAILRVIEEEERATHPYTSSVMIAERLDATLEEVESQLQVMETNGQVRLARTSAMSGQWEARLTPSGRRELGGPATVQTEETAPATAPAGGNVGAVERDHIREVEVITQHAIRLEQQGHERIAKGLKQLTDSITASQELSPEEKDDALESLHRISELATMPPVERSQEEVVATLSALRNDMLATDAMDEVWAAWESVLTGFFRL